MSQRRRRLSGSGARSCATTRQTPILFRAQHGPLIRLLNDEVKRRAEAPGDLRLTVHELREARLGLASDEGAWDTFTAMVERQAQQKGADP